MQRRLFIGFIAGVPFVAKAQGAANILALEKLVKVLGDTGDAISKLTKGFSDLVSTSVKGYDYVKAAREQARLKDISSKLAGLMAINANNVSKIDEYIVLVEKKKSSSLTPAWRDVTVPLAKALLSVKELLEDVQVERSDFILEKAYLNLRETLERRTAVLGSLLDITAPQTPDEVSLLRAASEKYKVLIENTKACLEQLNAYIKTQKK